MWRRQLHIDEAILRAAGAISASGRVGAAGEKGLGVAVGIGGSRGGHGGNSFCKVAVQSGAITSDAI
jgi:hypothetical protein